MSDSPRSLSAIAQEIVKDWQPMYFAAVPYVRAMGQMNKITDKYGADTGESIVLYFMSNARTWKGDTARRIKAELRNILSDHKREKK